MIVTIDSGDAAAGSLFSKEAITIDSRELIVTGPSLIEGALTMRGSASLRAQGAEAEFVATGTTSIDEANLAAVSGGRILLPAATSYTGGTSTRTIQAVGAGSLIDLSGLTQLVGMTGNSRLWVSASSGGFIDISGVTTVSRRARIEAADVDSFVDLDSLTTLDGTGNHDRPADLLVLSVRDGGEVNAGNLATVVSGSLHATGGSSLILPNLNSVTLVDEIGSIRASGSGSLIDLPQLTQLVGPVGNKSLLIDAMAGGTVRLSFVESITKQIKVLAEGAGSLVDLPLLTTLDGTGNWTGSEDQLALRIFDGGRIDAPKIETLVATSIYVKDGMTFELPSVTSYASSGIHNTLLAIGQGSRLVLPALTQITVPSGGFRLNIEASEGGTTSLPMLTSLDGNVRVTAFTGGTVQLSSETVVLSKGSLNLIGGGVVSAGTLVFDQTTTGWGGKGTIDGNVVGAGPTMWRDNVRDSILVTGDFTQTASGTMRAEIGGLIPGDRHDQLSVVGTATIDGRLDVTRIFGFVPKIDDEVALITFASHAGEFANVEGANIGGGLSLLPSFDDDSLNLTAAYVVDSFADAPDANPGDGRIDDGMGRATLRAAIMETNALPGAQTIFLPAGTYALNIAGVDEDAAATGDLDITGELTIVGAAAETVIDALAIDRVFDVFAGVVFNLRGVTVTGGRTQQSGGGIRNAGAISLHDTTVVGNTADVNGGGVFNDVGGTTTIVESSIVDNTALEAGGGVYTRGVVFVTDSTIGNNQANGLTEQGNGGGIHVPVGGNATILRSLIKGNSADRSGGGLYSEGAFTIRDTTIEENSSGSFGGGIHDTGREASNIFQSTIVGNSTGLEGGGIWRASTKSMYTNVTITGNTSDAEGGGIWNHSGTVILIGATITANTAPDGGAIFNDGELTLTTSTLSGNTAVQGAGLFNTQDATATIRNSTITENSAGGGELGGEVIPKGAEFLVNNTTAGTQENPSVDVDREGNFVIVWQTNAFGPDRIHGRALSNEPKALGSQFQVSATSIDDRAGPAIAMDDEGNFLVAWQGWNQDGSEWGIGARRFNASTGSFGGEIRVNTSTAGSQANVGLSMNGDGLAVAVWKDASRGIRAQRFGVNGGKTGSFLGVSSGAVDRNADPKVSIDADGRFAVVWDNAGNNVYGRRFAADGTPLGDPFALNTSPAGTQFRAAVTLLDDGRMIAIWRDHAQKAIVGRIFGPTGEPLTDEIRLVDFDPEVIFVEIPQMVSDASGNFAVISVARKRFPTSLACGRGRGLSRA